MAVGILSAARPPARAGSNSVFQEIRTNFWQLGWAAAPSVTVGLLIRRSILHAGRRRVVKLLRLRRVKLLQNSILRQRALLVLLLDENKTQIQMGRRIIPL